MQQYQSMDQVTKRHYQTIAKVMERSLELSNLNCVESALHGLGHLATFQPDLAVPIIDHYLSSQPNHPSQLIKYAKAARIGMIQ